ncbi:hypothetical protein FO440_00230 [Mucilaginibacter corticis]|uniref:Carboxypeptidase regulatory-like domain-containing protein n=1 Tax=Mucilaginibacter corticis TaxID=2597670 RepID=A0A556MRR2_9SPHI|nr:carboxypeptidase regulatory-like domain-containing protein [Mucilaginibacter corticis]TSJ42654.1 hypothetical protein FO440_00230 [Mucilaginibacter corticis]
MKTLISLPARICLLFSLFVLFAFTRKGQEPIDKLVTALQFWTDSIPQEKVYLHMDKPYYALGDTIWFKGYLTIGSRHQLSALSGAVYVDLITEQDSLVRSLKLPVTSGMVMGDFILSDELKEGSYRIRAYTQWMRNAGPEYFYDHTFAVGDIGDNIVTKADYNYHDVNGKPILTAMLNYTDNSGKPIAGRNVRYTLMIGKRPVWSQNVKTDLSGNVPVKIVNDQHANLIGSYIHTSIQGTDKFPVSKDFPIKAGLMQTDVQFFPESGSLVNGISSKVAFKAVSVDGLGTAIKGKIVDETNNQVTEINTLHAGMGSFLLKPEAGKSYTANITFADGSTRAIPLPKALDDGYVLSVYQPNKDSVLVRIRASANKLHSSVNLIVHSSGETIFGSPMTIGRPITSIWLEKRSFPSGIAQFTLFDGNGDPLNERIAFIKGEDKMQLAISSTKITYGSKEHVLMDLEAKDGKGKPTFGNFSVAVTDESKMPVDESGESTIFSNILLTSDIKGYVEKPNYYFINDNDETDKALDNLMLTQGYRRFEWKELSNMVSVKPTFPVEGLGLNISGMVTTLSHKPLANANVMLMALRAGATKITTSDANGRFRFDNMFVTDSIKFTIQARTAKNSDKTIVTLDSVPKLLLNKNPNFQDVSANITGTLKTYLDNEKKEDDINEKLGRLDQVHRLREVRIRAKKPAPPPYKDQGMYQIPEGHADQSYKMNIPENAPILAIYLQGQLKGVIFTYDPNIGGFMPNVAVILDGRPLKSWEVEQVFNDGLVDGESIEKIDMVTTNKALMSYLGGPSMLIYTKRGYIRKNYTPSITNIIPKGFNKVREFYSPRYDRPGNADKVPDMRTTVYWNPYLKTDISGKTSFNFFNADGPGTYRVVVEGINAAGELGRQVFHYTVDGSQAAMGNGAGTVLTASTDKGLSLITDSLGSLNKRLPAEKVYLHTDKPYYNTGDTLWFKSYVLDNNYQPSKLSGILYVELDNDTAEMVRHISIPIKDGIGWGQIPLSKNIFREGGYTLRAFTNWMQNFGQDYIFSQRFYLGQPSSDSWLVKSTVSINQVADKDQLQVELKLNHADKFLLPVAVKKVEVKIYDGDHYLFKEDMQTGIDGSLKFGGILKEKMDGHHIRAQIISLEKGDNFKTLQVPLHINRNQKIDLQFLPEGGKLVAGLKSVVGFKAIAESGSGANVSGSIYDSKGSAVTTFASLHNGMGSFEFTPKAGEMYTAKIAQSTIKSFRLPAISPVGAVMHVSNAEQGKDIKISIEGANSLGTDSACYIIGTSRGMAYYSEKIAPGQTELTVPKKLFPSGMIRFALLKGRRPLNERAVFIDNKDGLNIKVSPNKTAYVKRDSVGLEIEVKDKNGIPVQGNFSLAVNDDTQVKPDSLDNNGIAASLLINSELKGHIESPGYYINRKDKDAWQALDNLMLTQGWTGYDWKDVFTKPKAIAFKAEKELVITGKVVNVTNKPLKNASVLLSSQKPAFITTANVDNNGVYVFKNLPPIDSGSFFIQANNTKGKKINFGAITVDRLTMPPISGDYKEPILPWYINTDSTQLNNLKRAIEKNDESNLKLTGRVLKEVKIKSRKIIKGTMNPFGAGEADEIYDEEDIKKSATTNLYELLRQKMPGLSILGTRVVNFRGIEMTLPILSFNGLAVDLRIDGGPVSVDIDTFTDGIPPDITNNKIFIYPTRMQKDWFGFSPIRGDVMDALGDYKLPGLIGLEISYSRKYTNRLCFACDPFAVVQVTTAKGMGWYRRKPVGVVSYRPLPLLYPQQFYSPKYNVTSNVTVPDYRTTLYWDPNITTDQNGKARVSFYTSDIKDKYTIKISGIDTNGGIGDGSFKLNDNTKGQTF